VKNQQDKWQNYGLYSRLPQQCLCQYKTEFRGLPLNMNKYRISEWRAIFINYSFYRYGYACFFSNCAEQTWHSRSKGAQLLNYDCKLKQSLSELSHECILTGGIFGKKGRNVDSFVIYSSPNLFMNLTSVAFRSRHLYF
jgi:hypothetical protein